jgi:hypothetical protein
VCVTEGDKTMGNNLGKNMRLVNHHRTGIDKAGVRGIRLKKMGGGGGGGVFGLVHG